MKKSRSVPIYPFDELGNEAKNKAVCQHIEFMLETDMGLSEFQDCIDRMEQLRTPWFLGQCIYDVHYHDVADIIRLNEYWFYEDGSIVPGDLVPETATVTLDNGMHISRPDYEMLPVHIRNGMRDYVEEGVMPGHFIQSVLMNDLVEAFARADATNSRRMRDIVEFVYNELPTPCWGSAQAIQTWVDGFEEK